MKLTRPQMAVLRKLDSDGAYPSIAASAGIHVRRYVRHTIVAALLRKGLVRHIPATPGVPEVMYGITNEGRAALKESKA